MKSPRRVVLAVGVMLVSRGTGGAEGFSDTLSLAIGIRPSAIYAGTGKATDGYGTAIQSGRSYAGPGIGGYLEAYYRDAIGLELGVDQLFLQTLTGGRRRFIARDVLSLGYMVKWRPLRRLELGLGGAQYYWKLPGDFTSYHGLQTSIGAPFHDSPHWKAAVAVTGFYVPSPAQQLSGVGVNLSLAFVPYSGINSRTWTEPSKGAKSRKSQARLLPDYQPPQRVAILPWSATPNVQDPEAGPLARDLARASLTRKGYGLVEEAAVDSRLQSDSSLNAANRTPASAQILGQALEADALVFGEVREFRMLDAGLYRERIAEVYLRLVRASDGVVLFENRGRATDRVLVATLDAPAERGGRAGTPTSPMRPIAASAINRALRPLPPTPSGLKDFGGRAPEEIDADEKCVTLASIGSGFVVWTGTEIDVFGEYPVCYNLPFGALITT